MKTKKENKKEVFNGESLVKDMMDKFSENNKTLFVIHESDEDTTGVGFTGETVALSKALCGIIERGLAKDKKKVEFELASAVFFAIYKVLTDSDSEIATKAAALLNMTVETAIKARKASSGIAEALIGILKDILNENEEEEDEDEPEEVSDDDDDDDDAPADSENDDDDDEEDGGKQIEVIIKKKTPKKNKK